MRFALPLTLTTSYGIPCTLHLTASRRTENAKSSDMGYWLATAVGLSIDWRGGRLSSALERKNRSQKNELDQPIWKYNL